MSSRSNTGCAAASLATVLLLLTPTFALSPTDQPRGGGVLQFTEKLLFRSFSQAMLQLTSHMREALGGKLRHEPSSPPQQVHISCLNSVAPDPLGWALWCPDTHANVTQWVDLVGSTHRKVLLQAQPTMTVEMASW